MTTVVFSAKKAKRILIPVAAVAVIICAAALIMWGGSFFSGGEEAAPVSAVVESNTQAVMSALEYHGVSTADKAIDIWAEGVKTCNGATQYSVMSAALKERYGAVMASTAEDWMLSSGDLQVNSWYIASAESSEDGITTANLVFLVSDGASEPTEATAKLTLGPENGHVVVSAITIDHSLSAFTGIQ